MLLINISIASFTSFGGNSPSLARMEAFVSPSSVSANFVAWAVGTKILRSFIRCRTFPTKLRLKVVSYCLPLS